MPKTRIPIKTTIPGRGVNGLTPSPFSAPWGHHPKEEHDMALTLTLKQGESVQVGNAVIKARTKGRTRLSIQAPKDVPIARMKDIDPKDQDKPMGDIAGT